MRRFAAAVLTAAAITAAGVAVAAPASAEGTFQTKANLNMRACQYVSTCAVEITVPKGADVYLICYKKGTSVNGDNIWYLGYYNPSGGSYEGYMSGDYINTGHDPNPSISAC